MSTPSSSAASTVDVSAEREVAAGIAWLDEHQPGWALRIDLDNLCLAKGDNCILCHVTQIFNYNDALTAVDLNPHIATELGFVSPRSFHNWQNEHRKVAWYDAAESLWRLEITRRQAAAKAEGQGS